VLIGREGKRPLPDPAYIPDGKIAGTGDQGGDIRCHLCPGCDKAPCLFIAEEQIAPDILPDMVVPCGHPALFRKRFEGKQVEGELEGFPFLDILDFWMPASGLVVIDKEESFRGDIDPIDPTPYPELFTTV